MAENTKIEWANHTFNPWIGCTKVSPGCDHCYAEAGFDKRRKVVQWGAGQPRKHTAPSTWAMPVKWNAEAERLGVPQTVFCASLADWADNEVPAEWRSDLAGLILRTPHLVWLLLTKRIGNAKAMLAEMFPEGVPPNVRVGASIVNQAEADRDIPKLLRLGLPNFLSMEPLLGPVDLTQVWRHWNASSCEPGELPDVMIDWVIVGGESGPQARPMSPDWVRSLRDQCATAGVPFLFKQWGEWLPMLGQVEGVPVGKKTTTADGWVMGWASKKAAGRLLDGRVWDGVPA